MKVLKSSYAALMTILGTALGIVGLVVQLAATATVTPVAVAWHAGRLRAERAHEAQATMASLAAKLGAAFEADHAASDEPGLGQYL